MKSKQACLIAAFIWSLAALLGCAESPSTEQPVADPSEKTPIKVLIIDGQNNHKWETTTPVLKKHLEDSGLFRVDVATSPPKGEDLGGFKPDFSNYGVVVSNYNGEDWSSATQAALVDYVRGGGGFVVVHAANNAFPNWKEYNQMIGLGGWGGRTEAAGPYIRYRDGKVVRDTSPGRGGAHGPQSPFQVIVRNSKHPITAGLPLSWMHAKDELYNSLRGPAENIEVLATAFSDPENKGTGEHEPMLFTVGFGEGRVFHTTLGHGPEAMQCVGFIATLVRGTQWAAIGKVTAQGVPDDFPSPDEVSTRE